MKKYLVFLFLILLSCQKDEIIIEPTPTQEMIFDLSEVFVKDGQDISFEIITNEQHQLIISTQDGSVLTKETFQPEIGINTRKIYTKSLGQGVYTLTLHNTEEVGTVSIIIE